MTQIEALKLALEALENTASWNASQQYTREQKAIKAIKAALEAKNEKPCPEFWDWLPKAYRHGDVGDEPRFTKYNMEVAFLAGKQSAALEAKDEPVATIDSLEQEIYENTRQFVSLDVMEWMLKRYYTTRPKQEAKDEPVAWRDAAIRLGEELSSVGPDGYYDMDAKEWLDWAMEQNPRGKHSLPQRKPLTDEEIVLIVAECAASHQHTDIHFARAIEAAHGIKGEA